MTQPLDVSQVACLPECGLRVLDESGGALRLALPAKVDAPTLSCLRETLLEAFGHNVAVVLDVSAVASCDLFFHQLLCSARLSALARGIRLEVTGALDPDLRAAAASMGF